MWALVAGAGVVTAVVVIAGLGAPAGAAARSGTSHALLNRCARQVLGLGGRAARPVAGSADPQLSSDFAVLRRTRTRSDRLPVVARLGTSLASVGAATYDPGATVRLERVGGQGAVYAVPATLTLPTLSARCARLPRFAGAGSYLALRSLESGSGPGLCVVEVQREPTMSFGVQLPGRPRPKPRMKLTVTATTCQSTANLIGYMGAVTQLITAGATTRVLVPDGIMALTYTLADGRRLTAPVAANLATLPAGLSTGAGPHLKPAGLGAWLASHLPTTVTGTGPSIPPVTLTRPAALIPDNLRAIAFLRRIFTVREAGSSSDTSVQASCSARTHRCVAVIITTACNTQRRCTTTRKIKRYRYVGARPPRGTTGPITLPTGPILARVNPVFTRPRRLSLVLSGRASHRVSVIETVNCFARRSATAGGGGPTQRLAVPSRTRVVLPGHGYRSCEVSVLVIGARHDHVHARVVRG